MGYLGSVTLFVLLTLTSVVKSAPKCTSGLFLDRQSGVCTPCLTNCPMNHIIRKPCTAYRDTVCGPFYEFEFFNHGPDNSYGPNLKMTTPKKPGISNKSQQEEEDGVQVSSTQTKGPFVQSNHDKWQELCYGLIGALAIVSVVALLYVLISHYRAKRMVHKTITVTDPEDGGAIYYPAAQLLAADQLSTDHSQSKFVHLENQLAQNKHHRKLLRRIFSSSRFFGGNDYVDQVVSMDATRGHCKLEAIPEAEQEQRQVTGHVTVDLQCAVASNNMDNANSYTQHQITNQNCRYMEVPQSVANENARYIAPVAAAVANGNADNISEKDSVIDSDEVDCSPEYSEVDEIEPSYSETQYLTRQNQS